jgi:hypothetical protein
MGGGEWIEYPCEWVKGMEKSAEKVTSERNLLYVFFHRPSPRLEGNFHASPQMQKISQEQLIFVDQVVKGKPAGDLLALLKRCKVKKLPSAAITDKHGNLLYPAASTKDHKKLRVQVAKAKLNAEKIDKHITSRYERARDYCKERKYEAAAKTLAMVKKDGFVGLPQVKEIDKLFDQINAFMEKKLKMILEKNLSESQKRDALRSLKSEVYRELPVYAKVSEAYSQT